MAQADEMAAEATNLFSADDPLAMLLSLQAYERARTPQTTSAMIEAAGQPLDDLLAEGSPVYSVAFSPGGQTLAAGDNSGAVGLWDTATGKRTATLAEGSPVNSVAFSPGGQTLAAGDDERRCRPVGHRHRQADRHPRRGQRGRTAWRSARAARRSRPATLNGDVGLWDTATGKQTATLAEGSTVHSVAFSPGGQTLAAGDDNGDIGLWDTATGKRTATLAEGSTSTAWRSARADRRSRPGTLTARSACGTPPPANGPPPSPKAARSTSVAFSPGGQTLAAGDDNGDIGLWDTATGKRTASLTEGSPVYSVAFSPDGQTLAAGDDNGDIGLWDTATGKRTATLAEGSPVGSVAFSPDGQTLAAGDDNGDIGLWDTATGKRTATLAEGSPVTAWRSARAARRSRPGTSTATSACGTPPPASGPPPSPKAARSTSVAFSPDGQTLAAGDDNGESACGTPPPASGPPPSRGQPGLQRGVQPGRPDARGRGR